MSNDIQPALNDLYNKICDKYDVPINERELKTATYENNCSEKTMLNFKWDSCQTERRAYNLVLVYHPSNSKLGIAIKGTNLRVSFKYV